MKPLDAIEKSFTIFFRTSSLLFETFQAVGASWGEALLISKQTKPAGYHIPARQVSPLQLRRTGRRRVPLNAADLK